MRYWEWKRGKIEEMEGLLVTLEMQGQEAGNFCSHAAFLYGAEPLTIAYDYLGLIHKAVAAEN